MCKSWQIGDSICKSQNLKVSNSRCVESLCPRIVSVYLQIPSIFWINKRVTKRPFIYNVWIKYIIGTFIIFSPYSTDNVSVIQKFITHAFKMRKQKLIKVEEFSQNYTTTRYQKLVWARHSVLKGPVFINISKVFQQTEIKAILILSTYTTDGNGLLYLYSIHC